MSRHQQVIAAAALAGLAAIAFVTPASACPNSGGTTDDVSAEQAAPEQAAPEQAPGHSVTAVAQSTQWLVQGFESGYVALYDVNTGALVAGHSLHSDAITAVAIDTATNTVLSADASFGGDITGWELTTGTVTSYEATGLSSVSVLAALDNGQFLAAGDIYGQGGIERWSIGSANQSGRLLDTTSMLNFERSITAASLTPDGRQLVAAGHYFGDEPYLARFDVYALQLGPNARVDTPGMRAVQLWVPDPSQILTQTEDGSLYAFEMAILMGGV